MVGARVIVVVKDPFVASLLTREDVNVLMNGTTRQLPTTRSVPPRPDPLALPLNEFQCAHVDMVYEQKPLGEGRTRSTPTFEHCLASHETGFLCDYHDRILLDIKLSREELAQVVCSLIDLIESNGFSVKDNIIAEGVVKTDARAILKWPTRVIHGLKLHDSPPVPALRPYSVNPEWERVNVNAKVRG